ncbi:MAG: DNA double-strand break repair nuclease NurA [Pseudanabaenaceae cyanobacterium bins.68]|nr:DNA double-strand break repair nuclease NurA [Pseudanabaenaceae cyanobacterium bins.68]
MLNLVKIAAQMGGMSEQLVQESKQSSARILQAQAALRAATLEQEVRSHQRNTWSQGLNFSCAEPVEPLDQVTQYQPYDLAHSVIATDGSQIAPSRHEIAYCYLINIGRVALHYGCGSYPLLDSVPEVYYLAEDLYGARQWNIQTEEWMGLKRGVSEAIALGELGEELRHGHKPKTAPMVALSDGSLVYWFLENLVPAARAQILPDLLGAWRQLQAADIPIVGYVSAPRTLEANNFLRFQVCPYPEPDCPNYCGSLTLDQAPCSRFMPVRDASLWQTILQPGEASPLWRSHARILQEYEEQQIYFCYLHVGSEVARVEMPAWTALDAEKRSQVIGIILAQVQKGYGYPVALAEAHNQAVVTSSDRRRFFGLLEQQMLQSGLSVATTAKEARKRSSIA